MANRYWVGGTDNWNATAGSKWSTTSGGAGGSAVPTAADDVYIDLGAGAVTVTVPASTTVVCRSLNFVDGTGGAFTGTFALAATTSVITIGDGTAGAGNNALKVGSGMTWTNTGVGTINFVSTSATQQTITSGGKTMPNITINGAGSSYILGDALTTAIDSTTTTSITAGTFDTGNFAITGNIINSSGSSTRTITLGSSAISLARNGSAMQWTTTGLTVTANTATITCTGAATVNIGGVNMNGASLVFTGAGVKSLSTAGTWANMTVTGTAAQTDELALSANQTVTGTFTVTGNSAINRVIVDSNLLGTARTITAATTSLTNVDFRDITGAGAAAWTGTTIGDRLGNTGITTTTPATQTRDSTAGAAWSVAARWTSRVPLPQDDVVLNASSGNISATDVAVLGKSITATNYAGTITATSTNTPYEFYGDISLGGTFTQANTFYLHAYGRSSHTVTSNGKTMWGGSSNNRFGVYAPGGTYTIADAIVCQAGAGSALSVLLVQAGTFDTSASNYSVTTAQLQSATTTYARAVNLRSSSVTLFITSAQTVMNLAATNLTFTGSSATFNITGTTSTTKTWVGGGQTFGTVQHNSSGSLLYVSDTGNTFTNYTGGAGTGLRVIAGGTLTMTNSPTLSGSNYGYQRSWTAPAAGAFVSAPDSAALSITGDIDIRVKVALDDWTPAAAATLLGKWGTNNMRSYVLQVSTSGLLSFLTTPAGTSGGTITSNSSVATGVTDGNTKWVRATLDVDNGSSQNVVKFYLSDDGSTWTQLGTTVTKTGTTSIYDGTARLTIGGNDYQAGTATAPLLGKVYQAQVRNNILDDGTGIQLDANFETKTFGADTFTEGSSNAATVTIEGNATYGDGRVGLDTQTGGSLATIKKTGTGIFGEYDYLTIKDIRILEPYSFYGKTTSVDKTGNKNVNFTVKPSAPERRQGKYTSAGTSTCAITFDYTPISGNLLVVGARTDATGTYTTPTGWTLAKLNTDNTANSIIYYKVSDGTETGVTLTSSTTPQWRTMFVEYSGFSGTPALEQIDGNSGTSVTTLSTGSGVTNAGTAIGVAIFSHLTSTSLGSFTNDWQEEYIMSDSTTGASFVVKPLTASASQSTTKSWTSAANTTSSLALFNSASGFSPKVLFM